MIARTREHEEPEGGQGEMVLRSLDDVADAQGPEAHRFRAWAKAWVRAQVAEHGCVWTDDLNLAARAAFMEPANKDLCKSIYGVFWSTDARTLGIKRTAQERTGRGVDNNGRKARLWVRVPDAEEVR